MISFWWHLQRPYFKVRSQSQILHERKSWGPVFNSVHHTIGFSNFPSNPRYKAVTSEVHWSLWKEVLDEMRGEGHISVMMQGFWEAFSLAGSSCFPLPPHLFLFIEGFVVYWESFGSNKSTSLLWFHEKSQIFGGFDSLVFTIWIL